MATTTTNFGWDIPQSTDLVKDGATAIATLGQDIDTALVDLKGGTTGQILAKNSNTDLDYTWINNDQGDITGVTAGTGLTGGGTSGAVTLTNDMATTITASGDIVVGTGSGTYDNLPIGTTGQVLTADTSVSPYKVKWAAAAGSSGPAFRATRSSTDQSITSGAYTKLQYNVETFDTDSCYDSTTNYRFTPNKEGYYFVYLGAYFAANTGSSVLLRLYKNGAVYLPSVWSSGNLGPQYASPTGSSFVYMNGSTDYLEAYGYHGGTSPIFGTENDLAQCCAFWVRS